MVNLPDKVIKIVNDPSASKILATKMPDGESHVINAGSIFSPDPKTIAFASIFMKRTWPNLEAMKKKKERVTVLVTKEYESYEIKCNVKESLTSGQLFDAMNEKLKAMGLNARGVWVLEVAEVWNQSASGEAGTKII